MLSLEIYRGRQTTGKCLSKVIGLAIRLLQNRPKYWKIMEKLNLRKTFSCGS
jgi:hypothetical protein